jgi:hypothetical protein
MMINRSPPKLEFGHVATLLLGAAWLTSVQLGYAAETGHMPLTAAELARRVKMQPLPMKFEPGVFETNGVKIQINSGGDYNLAVFSGRDEAGRSWICWAWLGALEGALYEADLGGEGSKELIFVAATGGNGWAPSSQILTLVLEPSGRPLVTRFDGYFTYDGAGVQDMIDFAGDGHAALARQSFDDGFWVTSLYTWEDRRWKLAKGRIGDRSFPLHTRFTKADNHTATTPIRGRHPREDDLSTASAGAGAPRIKDIEWSENEQSLTVALSDGRRCVATDSTVVVDTKGGRQIATGGAKLETRKLLEQARRDLLAVTPFGLIASRDHEAPPPACAPNTIWAQEPPN